MTADVMIVCCCVVDNLRLFSTSKVLSQDKGGRDQDGKEDNENEEQPEGELWSSSGHLPAERTSGKHASVSEWDYEYSQLLVLNVFHIRPATRIPLGHNGSLWPLCLLRYVLFAFCRTSSMASALHDAHWSKLRIVLLFDIACLT